MNRIDENKAKDAVNDLLDRYFEKRCEKITSSVLEILSKKKETATNAPVKTAVSFLSKIEAASIPKLTPEQFSEIKKEMVKDGHPVRFLYNGQALDIVKGELASKGSNVIYHPMYWNFTKDTANKIAKWLKVKPVFDQG